MVLYDQNYKPPFYLLNQHVHTVYASLYRNTPSLPYNRERWETPDNDFIDIDFINNESKNLVIIGHGLEGDSSRPYITNTAKLFHQKDWDVCAWNCRSCSGEMNRKLKLYSHGDTSDLEFLIDEFINLGQYENIALIGFSMGGAIIMNYLGGIGAAVPPKIKAAVAISSPCDIQAASQILEKGFNRFYKRKFMRGLKEKIKLKAEQFPDKIDITEIDNIDTWRDFDTRYSAPIGGFEDADEFYYHCSAKHRIPNIQTPTLLINALDDPILSKESYPIEMIKSNPDMTALYPKKGGHVAFLQSGKYFSFAEENAWNFITAILSSQLKSFHKQFEKS